MKHRWFAFLSVLVLAALILSSADSAADATRGRTFRRPPRGRAARLAALAGPPPNGLEPANPCLGYEPDGSPYPPGCTTTGTTSTTGTSSSSGSSSGSTSTAGGSTGTTSGPPSTTGNTTSTTGSPPGPNPNPNPDPGPTTGTTATTGTNGSTGTTTGSTGTTSGGTTSGSWSASGQTTLDDGTKEMGYVSGTNVNVTFTLSLTRPSGSSYDQATVTEVDLKIGDASDSTIPPQSLSQTVTLAEGASGSAAVKVRFGSTRFADGHTISLDATFHYTLSTDGANPTGDQTCALSTVHVVSYNKGLALATHLIYNGTYYPYDTDPVAPNYDWDSANAVPDGDPTRAFDALKAMNHTVAGSYLAGGDVLTNLNTMTAFFAYTHGESNGFFPSVGSAANGDAQVGDKLIFGPITTDTENVPGGAGSAVGQAVWGTGGPGGFPLRQNSTKPIPLPNMVILHACSGIQSGTNDILHAFALLAPQQVSGEPGHPASSQVDRAFAGFDTLVNSRLYSYLSNPNNPPAYLSAQAKAVYQALLQGQTISEAIEFVNKKASGLRAAHLNPDNSASPLRLIYKGDVYARLMGVYTGDGTTLGPNAAGNLTWYLVNPAQP